MEKIEEPCKTQEVRCASSEEVRPEFASNERFWPASQESWAFPRGVWTNLRPTLESFGKVFPEERVEREPCSEPLNVCCAFALSRVFYFFGTVLYLFRSRNN